MMRLDLFSGRKLRLAFSFLLALVFVLSNRAEAAGTPNIPPACNFILKQLKTDPTFIKDLQNLSKSPTCFWELALQSQRQLLQNKLRALAATQKSASTIQTGAPTGSNGTTSAVSKPITPLSLATEYGGITTSTSNQTMTLQTTLDGIPSALATHGIKPYCVSAMVTIPGCIYWKDLEWLNRLGVGVTANTTSSSQNIKGSAAPPQGTAQQASLTSGGTSAPSLSSVFAKGIIWRGPYKLPEKEPSGEGVAAAQVTLASGLSDVPPLPDSNHPPTLMSLEVWQNYQKWKQTCVAAIFTSERLKAVSENEIKDLFFRYYARIVGVLFRGESGECSSTTPPPVVTGENLSAPFLPNDEQKKLISAFEGYIASASLFLAQVGQQILSAAAAPVLSVEYDYNTPVNQPTTSTVKLVGSKAFGPNICTRSKSKNGAGKQGNNLSETGKDPQSGNGAASQDTVAINRYTGTINVGGNFYNSAPSNVPSAGAFRDLQAGAEMDVAFCTSAVNVIGSFLGNTTVGLTYYYQDQVSPSILKVTPGVPLPGISITGLASSTSSVFATKGPINFAQLKFGLGTGKNVKFPIAVSWSNRTDLITHSLWSAQFGVSYDFSSLLNSSGTTNPSGGGKGASQ